MKNKGFFKTALCAGAIAAASIFNPLQAYSQGIEEKPATEQTLEKKVSTPKIKIDFNYQTGSRQESVDYSTSKPQLTLPETNQIQEIMDDIKDGGIDSYQELIENYQNLSENQKIVLLAAIGGALGSGSYDSSYQGEVFSQETFFNALQDYLETGNQNSLGVCRHIASHLEQLANDAGIRAAAVTGRAGNGEGHAYNILKTENGTGFVDYSGILLTGTKNIEKALEAYQMNAGAVAFQHLFFDHSESQNPEFQYRLITKDGRNFLDFVGYDETSETLKKILTQTNSQPEDDLAVSINMGDYLTSGEFNCFGFFTKIGEIRGDANSPMGKMELCQIGYKREFSIFDVIYITPNISFIFGNLPGETDNNLEKQIHSLAVNTKNKEGLNLASRIAGNIFSTETSDLFHDFLAEAGASYKIPIINGMSIEPYLITQFALHPGDLGTYEFAPMLNEFRVGTVFDIPLSNDINLSFEPYYVRRIWENEFGANIGLETPSFGIDAKGYFSDSTYDFCPDKWGVKVGAHVNLENLELGIKYGLEGTNYDREIENNHSLSFGGTVKF